MIRGVAPHLRRAPASRPGYQAPEGPPAAERTPGAVPAGSAIAVFGCVATILFAQGETPAAVARTSAYGFAVSLAVTVYLDARLGVRNLIRADLLALAAYFFLTFFEFFFPQSRFNDMVTLESAHTGITALLLGAIGLIVGRHLWRPKERPLRALLTREIPPRFLVILFWVAMAIGYLHILLGVNFNLGEMINQFMAPRFSQPWTRGKFGDWKALIYELGLFINLLPPLGGIMLARRERYARSALIPIMAAVAFTFFYGFSGGTRNIFASYMVTFLIGYAFAAGPQRQKELLIVSLSCAVMMVVASQLMLQFRSIGMHQWLEQHQVVQQEEPTDQEVFIDYNLYAVCRLAETFPKVVPYLGWEIPYAAIIRPIPRAVWPGKPEGLTSSIEEALDVRGMTISATFAGEAYMSGGMLAVLTAGLAFGALFGWWNYLASMSNSEMGILIYSSGFFAAVISMRSMLVFTTALLPTVAAIMLGVLIVRQASKLEGLRRRLLNSRSPRPPPPGSPPMPRRGRR